MVLPAPGRYQIEFNMHGFHSTAPQDLELSEGRWSRIEVMAEASVEPLVVSGTGGEPLGAPLRAPDAPWTRVLWLTVEPPESVDVVRLRCGAWRRSVTLDSMGIAYAQGLPSGRRCSAAFIGDTSRRERIQFMDCGTCQFVRDFGDSGDRTE